MVMFAQWIVGPPGAGKTTYCAGMQQFLSQIGRKTLAINLDPANHILPYKCDVDIKDIVTVDDIMDTHNLGPNGALIFAAQFLLKNMDWLVAQLEKNSDCYVLFDCPGQIELYTHDSTMRTLVTMLQKRLDLRITNVHLVDSTLLEDPYKYVSAVLVSLSGQIQMELPHVNVFTKIDLLKKHRHSMDFRIDFYANVCDLENIIPYIQRRYECDARDMPLLDKRFIKFTSALVELLEDFNPVAFQLLDIQDKESLMKVIRVIDTSNGYCLSSMFENASILQLGLDVDLGTYEESYGTIQERYVDVSDEEE